MRITFRAWAGGYLHAHRLGESNMVQDKLIDAAQRQEARPVFAAGPLLTELLSDPIMHMLMAADRVEYRDIEAVLQRARSQLGLAPYPISSLLIHRYTCSLIGCRAILS